MAGNEKYKVIIDAMPFFVFVVDEDVRIQEYNSLAASLLNKDRNQILKMRGGDVLHCIHSLETPEGCGHAPFCKECIIRKSVKEAINGKQIFRKSHKLELINKGEKSGIYVLVTASPFACEGKQLVLLVIEDISEVVELKKLIPICSFCKKIYDDKKAWINIESYFKNHMDINFSHYICPECYEHSMKNIDKKQMDKVRE